MLSPLRTANTPLAVCVAFLLLSTTLTAQQRTPPPPPLPKPTPAPVKAPDYSQEALVIEHLKTTYRFEKDGTGRRELVMRVKVLSEAALNEFGQLIFPYISANEDVNINYVRVRKNSGAVVAASAADVQDLTAPISREAPVYTDVRQKHVTVPGLRPGDTLEYHVVWKLHTPLAANHFWLSHDFLKRDVIVLDEQLEVDVPTDSPVKLKTEKGIDPVTSEREGRRLYAWKHNVLEREEEKEDDKVFARRLREELEDPKPPMVQMTTFKTWEEVGQWYAALERDRIIPDEKIRARVAELIQDKKTDLEKIKALYEFVAKNFRYVSLSLGQGRYQPHAATEVLANQYGDCKDKHTLLTSMLIAAGLRAYPALMNSSRKIDPDVPSPGQFDHVISAIPLGTEMFWADTTAEVAPFRLLSPPLREKKALLIPQNAAPRLETTPATPPFVSREITEVDAQVSELGKLDGQVRVVLRGDAELVYRLAFRRTAKSQWKDLGLAEAIGVRGGEVSDIKTSDIEALDVPFELSFKFTASDFLDWSAKKLTLTMPLPGLTLPDVAADKEEGTKAIQIGVPIEVTQRLKLVLPAKYQIRIPVAIKVGRDYATYSSVYKLERDVVLVERTYQSRLHEIPAARTPDYRAFVAAVQADAAQMMSLETTNVADGSTIPDSVKTDDLMAAAEAASKNNNFPLVESLLNRVLQKEPKHKTARRQLGYALFAQGKFEGAAKVLREQTVQNPFDDYAYMMLGQTLWAQQSYAEAENAFRKHLEIVPLDKWGHGYLGLLLVEARKYKEAIPELEHAISLNPEQEAGYQIGLGRAYLSVGENEKGAAAFDRAVKLAPGQSTWNNVAYYLAVNKVQLDRAQQYAESAVTEVATKLRNVELQNLTLDDLRNVSALAAYWDTLGWVLFQKGDIDTAEKYIVAAWRVAEHGEVGYHLGQILEKRGKPAEAIRLYAQAAYASRTVPEALQSLERLVGKEKSLAEMNKNALEAANSRTVEIGPAKTNVTGATEARFFIALAPGPNRNAQVVDVKFISGDEKLRPVVNQLKSANFGFIFPDEKVTKIIRRGTLSCYGKNNLCSFIMMSPDYVPLD